MTPSIHPTTAPATLDDLMGVKGKAELIGGRIVQYMSTGLLAHRIARRITRSLDEFIPILGRGEAAGDNLGYAIRPPLPSMRESFSPDASFYDGPLPPDLEDFIDGPPTFAAEVRSKNDHGPTKDRDYADKRKDYFFAGTVVVWDVDPLGQTVTRYTAPDASTVFGRGEVADAEPAVPGWRLSVDELFAG